MSEYLPVVNLVLNLLILPLMAMMWSIRIDVAKLDARLTTMVDGLDRRIVRIELKLDKDKI